MCKKNWFRERTVVHDFGRFTGSEDLVFSFLCSNLGRVLDEHAYERGLVTVCMDDGEFVDGCV